MIRVQDLLNQIQELGYRVELIGDGIKFTYTRGGQTPGEAVSILKQFKKCKKEVVEYLQQTVMPEPQKPARRYDRELDAYIGKPSENPKGYRCTGCGGLGQRYCLALGNDGKWWWSWRCLGCSPERN